MNQSDIELVRQPIPNMDKIYAVLDQIEADPEHWDQKNWSKVNECGTSMCFAGWACKLNGYTLAVEVDGHNDRSGFIVSGASIMDTAETVLGLTTEEACRLFVGTIGESPTVELHAVKVTVQEISARAKEQQAAFERVAKELIESVPELEAVIQPGYLCPESQALVMQHLGGQDGGN